MIRPVSFSVENADHYCHSILIYRNSKIAQFIRIVIPDRCYSSYATCDRLCRRELLFRGPSGDIILYVQSPNRSL